jgi:hypothetical protein
MAVLQLLIPSPWKFEVHDAELELAYVNSRAVIFGEEGSWRLFSLATPFLPPRKQFQLRHVYLFRLSLGKFSLFRNFLGAPAKRRRWQPPKYIGTGIHVVRYF